MNERKLLLQSLAIAVAGIFSIQVYKDYSKWLKVMIPGGLPGNLWGYLVSNLATLVLRWNRRSIKSIDYSTTKKIGLTEGFLKESDIPNHEGIVPTVAKWSIPHRQTFPPKIENSVELSSQALKEVKESRPQDNLVLAPSKVELHLEGLFLDTISREDEVTHIHPKDGTMHVYLCAYDAEIALKKGWGELHPVKARYAPSKFESVLIFAPQSKEELEIHKEFVQAAISANIARKKKEF